MNFPPRISYFWVHIWRCLSPKYTFLSESVGWNGLYWILRTQRNTRTTRRVSTKRSFVIKREHSVITVRTIVRIINNDWWMTMVIFNLNYTHSFWSECCCYLHTFWRPIEKNTKIRKNKARTENMVKYSNITKNAQIFLSCSPSEDRSIRYQNFLKLILKISASFAWNAIDQTTSVPRIFNNKINSLQTCLEKYGMALPGREIVK